MGSTDLVMDHVQITVVPEAEAACQRFYGSILGLREIAKPENLKRRGGAWYDAGAVELHVSIEPAVLEQNRGSKRHVRFRTDDLASWERRLRAANVEIIEDDQPVPEWIRFYVRDPAGCRIEIAQRVVGR
jgi:catechol 2,3-dioxygenase-like lactoylglutathione lyase family enzyme